MKYLWFIFLAAGVPLVGTYTVVTLTAQYESHSLFDMQRAMHVWWRAGGLPSGDLRSMLVQAKVLRPTDRWYSRIQVERAGHGAEVVDIDASMLACREAVREAPVIDAPNLVINGHSFSILDRVTQAEAMSACHLSGNSIGLEVQG